MTLGLSWVCLFLTSMMSDAVLSTNPGVKARITKKGIDYANQIAQASLNKDLAQLKIGDQSGSGHHFTWELKNIQTRSVAPPSSQISLDPPHQGLAWSLTNFGLSLHADWRVKYKKGWVKVSDSGSIDVNIKGVSMAASIRFGVDSQGRPSISTASCSAHISDVDVKFHGGTAFIYNLFRGPLEDRIKGLLQPQICKILTKAVNTDGEANMQKLKVTVDIGNKFLLDYRLISPPIVTTEYLDTLHKGVVTWVAAPSPSPLTPDPIPDLHDPSRMLHLWLTQFTPDSLAEAAQRHGYLTHSIVPEDLPAANRSLLNTSCVNTMCVGRLIPQIGKSFPDAVVNLTVTSTAKPNLTMTDDTISLTTKGNVDMYATKADGSSVFLLTLNMTVSIGLEAAVQNERLVGQVKTHKFEFGVVKSNVGKINPRGINIVLGMFMELAVLPKLNALGAEGVALPVSGEVTLVNTKVSILQGCLLVSSDVVYKKNGQPLLFQSEHS